MVLMFVACKCVVSRVNDSQESRALCFALAAEGANLERLDRWLTREVESLALFSRSLAGEGTRFFNHHQSQPTTFSWLRSHRTS